MSRDPFFKCVKCGKFLSYKEVENVKEHFIPDSDVSREEHWVEHKLCDVKQGLERGNVDKEIKDHLEELKQMQAEIDAQYEIIVMNRMLLNLLPTFFTSSIKEKE